MVVTKTPHTSCQYFQHIHKFCKISHGVPRTSQILRSTHARLMYCCRCFMLCSNTHSISRAVSMRGLCCARMCVQVDSRFCVPWRRFVCCLRERHTQLVFDLSHTSSTGGDGVPARPHRKTCQQTHYQCASPMPCQSAASHNNTQCFVTAAAAAAACFARRLIPSFCDASPHLATTSRQRCVRCLHCARLAALLSFRMN